MARLVEEYIKQDVEIMMYIDNNKMIGGGGRLRQQIPR